MNRSAVVHCRVRAEGPGYRLLAWTFVPIRLVHTQRTMIPYASWRSWWAHPYCLADCRLLTACCGASNRIGANLSIGVAVLSYDGALTITLTADDLVWPDVDVFAAGIERSLAQLGVTALEPPPSIPGDAPPASGRGHGRGPERRPSAEPQLRRVET